MKTKYIILMLSSLLLVVTSCQQQVEVESVIDQEALNQEELKLTIRNLSISMSNMLNELEVRELIKKRVLLQFDGDYDILYKDIKDVELSDGLSFEQKLISLFPASDHCKVKLNGEFAEIPQLQISVPVNCENWDTKAFVPPVAMQPFGQDEAGITKIEAYENGGKLLYLPAKEDPEFPVVVIGLNERTDEAGNLLPPYMPDGLESLQDRVSGEYEKLKWIRIPDLSGIEGWAAGKVELEIIVVGATGIGTDSKAANTEITKKVPPKISREDITSGIDLNYGLFNWKIEPTSTYTTTYSDEIKVKFIEIDNSGSQWKFSVGVGGAVKVIAPGGTQVSIPVASTGVEYTYKDSDDDCGDAIVDFDHPKPGPTETGGEYNTGSVRFRME